MKFSVQCRNFKGIKVQPSNGRNEYSPLEEWLTETASSARKNVDPRLQVPDLGALASTVIGGKIHPCRHSEEKSGHELIF
jgi:hypothetical protein